MNTVIANEAHVRQPEGSDMCLEFDIHRLVGIQVIGASREDAECLTAAYGEFQDRLTRGPDIVVRFVPHIPVDDLRYVEVDGSGFSDDRFYILRVGDNPTVITLDFGEIGHSCCNLICEQGTLVAPLLNSLMRLLLLTHGYIAAHASAFVQDDMGVLVTGWAKGGKTEALLAFGTNNAEFVGDDWVVISPDGKQMLGVPSERIRLWDWHLQAAPELQRLAKRGERWMFAGIHGLDRFHQRVLNSPLRSSPGARLLRSAMPAVKRRLSISVEAEKIFPRRLSKSGSALHKVFLLLNHSEPTYDTRTADPALIARRMSASFQYEMWPLMRHYYAFRFAFPDRKNAFLEKLGTDYERLLCNAMVNLDTYTVRHPYPFDFRRLRDSMLPYVESAIGREHIGQSA
jgi:hypothetical protein